MKRLLSTRELDYLNDFVSELNCAAKDHGIILDSESPILIAVGGVATPLSVAYDDEADAYDLYVGVPL